MTANSAIYERMSTERRRKNKRQSTKHAKRHENCSPAADSPVPQSALLIADLALVPIVPSPLDLWASVGMRQVIENVGSLNENLIARLVVNQCQPKTILAKDTLEVLPEFGIPVWKNFLRQRTAYRQSAVFGDAGVEAFADFFERPSSFYFARCYCSGSADKLSTT